MDIRAAKWIVGPITKSFVSVALCWAMSGAATAQEPTAAAPSTPATGATAAGTPAEAAAPAAPSHAECEGYVAVLSGHGKDAKALEDPKVQALARKAPGLATCGAIAADSDALCKLVSRWSAGPKAAQSGAVAEKEQAVAGCHRVQFIFHEMRANPQGRSFMLPFTREECASLKEQAQSCTKFVDVLRAGDAAKCGTTGDFQSLCKAFMALDPSFCAKVPGLPDDLPAGCRDMIKQRGFLAKGLQALATSGPSADASKDFGSADELRAYAKAALGQADACAELAKPAMAACEESAAATSLPPTLVPATPGGTPESKSKSAAPGKTPR